MALLESGVDPVVVGLVMGLLTYAYTAARPDLERAAERFREFREQPTPELARSAGAGVRAAISPNDRLQQLFHPWTSYVIVPLFALANAGIAIDGAFLERAVSLTDHARDPVRLPRRQAGRASSAPRGSYARLSAALRPPVGWAAVAGGGTIAGVGFTVALLVATLAFEGPQLEEAKVGILGAAARRGARHVAALPRRGAAPPRLRYMLLLGTAEPLVDLYVDVDPERDHIRGPADAPVTLLEYGDFECPYCGQAEQVVRELLRDFSDVAYVLAAAAAQRRPPARSARRRSGRGSRRAGRVLADARPPARPPGRAGGTRPASATRSELGLDVDRFRHDLRHHSGAARVAEDVDSADLSGVSGTPTFFINGRRHYGAYDITTLSAAVRGAGARAMLATSTTD